MNKIAPWDKIHVGETVYFKNAGEPITAKATVKRILQFSNINNNSPQTQNKSLLQILTQFGKLIDFEKKTYALSAKQNTAKNYCILIYLKDPTYIDPFDVVKNRFGNACAWLCVDSIENIKTTRLCYNKLRNDSKSP